MQRRPSHLQPATGRARWAQWPASYQSGSRVAMMVPNLGATPLAQNGISPPPVQRDEPGAVLSFCGALFDVPDRGHLGSTGETFQLGILIWSRMRESFHSRSMADSSGET